MRRLSLIAITAALLAAFTRLSAAPQSPNQNGRTDLDALMAQALKRRDLDKRTLSDYVLDEVETMEILGPGGAPLQRFRREFTWYVRDGMHVRSPVKFDGVPIGEDERKKYEDRWIKTEENRRKRREERVARREAQGRDTGNIPPLNEPRFISEAYFLDFKFEPGNYYFAGHEALDKRDVLKIDYYPTNLFNDDHDHHKGEKTPKNDKEQKEDEKIDRQMNKTTQVTLWVDPTNHQIVKYTFDNVWLDFLPAEWLVRVDDIRASMEMGQPFPDVWLPRNVAVHAGITLAMGSFQAAYRREFSNYRKADVSSKVTIPKKQDIR